MSISTIKRLFLIASLYDVILGLSFALFYPPIYQLFGIELPNHAGYLELAGSYVAIFGVGFYLVSRDPVANRGLVLLGILMKIAFCAVVFGHLALGSIPGVYVPVAVIDLAFLAAFVAARTALERVAGAAPKRA